MRCVLLAKKMAKIWLKLQENGERKSQMAKVMAKEKYILARTLPESTRQGVSSACSVFQYNGLYIFSLAEWDIIL